MDLLLALRKGNKFMLRVFRNIVILTPLASRSQIARKEDKPASPRPKKT